MNLKICYTLIAAISLAAPSLAQTFKLVSSPQSLTRWEKKVSTNSVISIHLDAAGGWVGKITVNK